MNFVTLTYAGFLLAVTIIYWLIPRRVGRYWLIIASLVFYGSWNPVYLPGFAALVLANWTLGLLAKTSPRAVVTAAVAINLLVLGIFKYADWALGSSASVLSFVTGRAVDYGTLGLILPLAISFVTFTMLAYVIDVARGGRVERNVGRFALFVTFFPHLISGPIMRGHEFLPQVRHPRPFSTTHLRMALPLLVSGFLKKGLGDALAPTVNDVFGAPGTFATPFIWIGVLAFAFQILLDFSGYTDLALGSAHLLGFRLPRNFDWPYRSTSIQEFWRRWHMTLSRWLRDYLYFPLGGSRHGRARTYAALAMTMVLGGLWHGAGWTFLIWGAWHGAGLAAHRVLRREATGARSIPQAVAWIATFGFVLVGWVFFRAETMSDAFQILSRAVIFTTEGATLPVAITLLCLALLAGQWTGSTRLFARLAPAGSYRRYLAYGLAISTALILMPTQATDFIYFQF